MAFFKFRKEGVDRTASAAPTESVEVLRKRARHRLIGTAILVLVAVIGFPLLVDRQPRPVEFNVPIVIPDRNKVAPLPMPAPAAVPALAASAVTPALTAASAPASAPVETNRKSEPVPKAVTAQPQPVSKAAPVQERFVVQVGAYAEQTRAREARLKLERAGLKNYAQVVESKEGRRIRVRTGPYSTRAQAEHDAEKIKKLDLPASVLGL